MADLTSEVRFKVTPADHRLLTLHAQLNGVETQEVMRGLLRVFLDDSVHKATVLAYEAQREGMDAGHKPGGSP